MKAKATVIIPAVTVIICLGYCFVASTPQLTATPLKARRRFGDLPDNWVYPVCAASKDQIEKIG